MASFEMLLAADSTKVHRYDIEHGIYLGSFSNFMLGGFRGVVARAATGQAFVYTDREIHRFNYHTGSYDGSFTITGFDIRHVSLMNNGHLMITHSTGSTSYNPDTGVAGFGVNYVTGDVPMGVVQMASGKFIGLSNATVGSTVTNYHNRWSSTGVLEFSQSMLASSIPNRLIGVGKVGDRVAFWGGDGPALVSGSYKTVTEGGVVASPGSTSGSFDTYTATSGVTHNGDLIVVASQDMGGGVFTTGIQYARSSGGYWFYRASTNLPMNTRIMGATVVLAPEPGTMAVLGLGALAILRKRRSH